MVANLKNDYLKLYNEKDPKSQHLMSIRKDGQLYGHIEIDKNGMITTDGFIGENTYGNFVELIMGLQGFDLKIDNFYT